MVLSMTGYGKGQATYDGQTITAEIRSLNSRYLDLNVRVPSVLKEKELELRQRASQTMQRGKAELSISFEHNELSGKQPINKALFAAYYEELSDLCDEHHLDEDSLLDTIMKMPGILDAETGQIDEALYAKVSIAVDNALAGLTDFRRQEGQVLAEDMAERVRLIQRHLVEVEKLQGERGEKIRERITDHMRDFMADTNYDVNRLEQEMIYYVEKLDITEEIVRLSTHCNYFLTEMDSEESNGKKLGFIGQEIGREINTIGSKANHAGMQKLVVQMKDELEKIKEQLNNLL